MSEFKANQARYRRLSEPHESMDKAQEQLDAFSKGVEELREKHRIPDLVMVVQMNVIDDDKEVSPLLALQFGNRTQAPILAAFAHGQFKAEFDAEVTRMASGKTHQRK